MADFKFRKVPWVVITGKTENTVGMLWDAVPNALSYNIYRNGVLRANRPVTLYPGQEVWTDTGLLSNTTYTYSASAVMQKGEGTIGKAATVTTNPPPNVDTTAPVWASSPILTATAVSSSQINLSCALATDDVGVTRYKFERSLDGSTGWTTIQDNSTSRTYSDTGRSPSTQYFYRVSALDAAANQSAYGTASATTQASTALWAPNLASTGLTTIRDKHFDPGDSPLVTGWPTTSGTPTGTDADGMSWYAGDAPAGAGFSGTVAPIIDTVANIAAITGHSIPALPDDYPTIMAIKYPANWPRGYRPFGGNVGSSSTATKTYFCTYFMMPPSFDSRGNVIKWIVVSQTGGKNHILEMSSGGIGTYRGPWFAAQGAQNYVCGGTASNKAGAIVNLATPTVTNDGQWHCVEMYLQRETTPGVSADGIFKAWIDDTLVCHWNNLNFNAVGDTSGIGSAEFQPYLGGGGSEPAAITDQYIYVGRVLSAKGL